MQRKLGTPRAEILWAIRKRKYHGDFALDSFRFVLVVSWSGNAHIIFGRENAGEVLFLFYKKKGYPLNLTL